MARAEHSHRIHQIIASQARCNPNAIAAIYGDRSMTYERLNVLANQVAHYLIGVGVSPGVRVSLCLDHGFDLMSAVLGILKAGGVCVPLEPSFPDARLQDLLIDTRSLLTITQESIRGRIDVPGAIVCMDADAGLLSSQPRDDPIHAISGRDPAFIFYTSGTTGSPKGVVQNHDELSVAYSWMEDYFDITAHDCGLMKTSCHLVGFRGELLSMLVSGARTVIADAVRRHDIEHLVDLIAHHGITLIRLTPSMLRVLLDSPRIDQCVSLRHIVSAGESLPRDLEERCLSTLPATLHVGYGATEAPGAAYRTCRLSERHAEYRIGRPVSKSYIRILSQDSRPVSLGDEGEICIGGAIVSQGYWNQPELTAARFIQDPLVPDPEARLYRTGDRGYELADGQIVYLGRADLQANLRGIRIDLNEIEDTLRRHPGVSAVVTLVREDRPGDQLLVAYLTVPADQVRPSVTGLREFLKDRLPDAMIPSVFVFLKQFPVGSGGKVDRGALPAAGRTRGELDDAYVAARSPSEERIAAIWQDVLNLDSPPGVHDRFLDLGGTSLLAVRLVQVLESTCGTRLPLAVLQEFNTVAQLADAFERRDRDVSPFAERGSRSALQDKVYRALLSFQAGRQAEGLRLATGSLLMRFNPDATGIPLYLCGAFRELAARLPRYPIIGMDTGYGAMATVEANVQALADLYVTELDQHGLPEPFVLVGYSLGAWVAFEMAQRLLHQSRRVPLLCLIDHLVERPYAGRVALFIADQGVYRTRIDSPSWLQAMRETFSGGLSIDRLHGDHHSILAQGAIVSIIAERIEAYMAQTIHGATPALPLAGPLMQLTVPDAIQTQSGTDMVVPVTIRNASREPWVAEVALRIGHHWYDEHGRLMHWAAGQAEVPLPLAQGHVANVRCRVQAPDAPGAYRLVFDLLDCGGSWGSLQGIDAAEVPVEVAWVGRAVEQRSADLVRAGQAWTRNDDPATIRYAQKVLSHGGEASVELLRRLARALLRWGRLETGLATTELGLRHHSDDAVLLQLAASHCSALGRDDAAIAFGRRLTKIAPDGADGWSLLAHSLMKQEHVEEAIHAFRRALELRIKLEDLQALATCLEQSNQFEAAVVQWRQALALRPEQASLHLSLARALRKSRQTDAALDACRNAIAQRPTNVGAYRFGMDLLRELGRGGEALELLDSAPPVLARSVLLQWERGECLMGLGRVDEAADAYRCALHESPIENPNLVARLAEVSLHDGQDGPEAALEILDPALARYPDHFLLRVRRGDALLRLGLWVDARLEFQEAIRLNSTHPHPWACLGEVYRLLGQVDESRWAFQSAINLGHGNAEHLKNLLS